MDNTESNHSNRGSRLLKLREGAAAAWPICLGYFPIGLALGVLAQKAAIGPVYVLMMSVLVFAGSAQFVGVAMIGVAASPLSIIFTTFLINIRHLLMSSALAVHLQGEKRLKLSLYSYGITDESFAVNLTRFRTGNWDVDRAIIANQVANAVWIISTVAGSIVGQVVPVDGYGIEYALPAMFIALLVLQMEGMLHVMVALLAAVIAIGWKLAIPGDSYMIAATLLATTAGFFLKRQLVDVRQVSDES